MATRPAGISANRATGRLIQYGICSLFALIVVVPLVAAVVGGLKTTAQVVAEPFGVPDPFV